MALRVRGTLNLTSGQNENDLHIAFKHLIEKVGGKLNKRRIPLELSVFSTLNTVPHAFMFLSVFLFSEIIYDLK